MGTVKSKSQSNFSPKGKILPVSYQPVVIENFTSETLDPIDHDTISSNTDTLCSEPSLQDESSSYGDTNINELCYYLSLETDIVKSNKLLLLCSTKIIHLDQDGLSNFWINHSDIIISKIYANAAFCVYLNMHLLPSLHRYKCMEKLGIKLFKNNIEEALLLINNLSIAVILLRNVDSRLAKFLEDKKDINSVKNKAFKCMSLHRFGLARILFLKANYQLGANNIIRQNAPEYIKTLYGIKNLMDAC